jgi:hypothetical protein
MPVALAFSTVLAGQVLSPPTLTRLQELKLESIDGDVPAHYSETTGRDIAASLAARIADCRAMHSETAGQPPIVLAMLDARDWKRLTPVPYGMPHHSAVETPYVVVVPRTWQDAPPMLAGARNRVAEAVGQNDVDRYMRLIALHEVGHIITGGVLGENNPDALLARFPVWYVEFVANYFAANCLGSRPDDAALFRRGEAALVSVSRQKYTRLADWDRLMMDSAGDGQPFLMTEAGGLNFARYQGVTFEMASRVRDSVFSPRMIPLLRQQWARPGRRPTEALLRDFVDAVSGLRQWLVQQGAV